MWSYPTCYGYAGQFKPWPTWFVSAQNIQYAAAHRVTWIYLESTVAGVGSGGLGFEMEPLRGYLTAAMMWKPSQDWATLVSHFLDGYYGEGSFGVRQYLDEIGGAEASSHFYLSQYNPLWDDPTKNGFLHASYLTPTSILSSVRGLTAARKVAANSVDKARAAVLTKRIDAAKMPIYLVILYRWHELTNFTEGTRQEWPIQEHSLDAAFAEYTRIFKSL
eukprot:SAG31_NODE_16510_length_706_cov_1.179572_1_plen_218_part_10